MAVTTTPRDIISAAYAKSKKNAPGTIATETTELLQLVVRSLRGIFGLAARINPTFFAGSLQVPYAGGSGGWPRPEGAESIFRIETAAGVEVAVVPFDDRKAEEGMPSVYTLGQVYFAAGNPAGPSNVTDLRFWFARRPASPANLDAALDSQWVESYNELLILDVAIYLARKDGRLDEVPALAEEQKKWATLFIAFLEHETANERRRFGHVRRINTNTVVPLGDFLAGGAVG